MSEAINPIDIRRHLFKYLNGGRSVRLVHVPTGIAVEAFVAEDESSIEVNGRLMKELSERVISKPSS